MESFIFYLCTISASLGSGFQHGYNAAVLNSPQEVIIAWIRSLDIKYLQNEADVTLFWATVVSMFTVGGMIGGFVSPLIIMLGGRRGGLIISAVIAIVGAVLMYLTKMLEDPMWLMAGRVLSGVNCGINGALCPIYLTEISPINRRGASGSLYQLFLTAAIPIANVLSMEPIMGSDSLWQNLFLVNIAVAVFEIIGLLFVPESPKYLLDKVDKEEKASKAYNRFHGHKPTAEAEFAEMKAASQAAKQEQKLSMMVFFSEKTYYRPLALCVFLMVAQQMTGINAVIFYSTDIFKKAHMSQIVSQFCTGGIGIINFLATVVTVAVIDKSGRKPLLAWGFVLMIASTSLLLGFLYITEYVWARWLSYTVVLIFVVSFAIGAGPIPWMLSSEVFVTNARPIAGAFIVPTNWCFNLVVALGFPPLQENMGPLVFVIFVAFQVVSLFVILIFMPETKNRAVEDIIKDFS